MFQKQEQFRLRTSTLFHLSVLLIDDNWYSSGEKTTHKFIFLVNKLLQMSLKREFPGYILGVDLQDFVYKGILELD